MKIGDGISAIHSIQILSILVATTIGRTGSDVTSASRGTRVKKDVVNPFRPG
jgi:hypothetical protein